MKDGCTEVQGYLGARLPSVEQVGEPLVRIENKEFLDMREAG